jgi:aminopeptidase N
MYGLKTVHEEFDRAVFTFTDDTYGELKAPAKQPVPPAAGDAWKDWRETVRRRIEPRSLVESMLMGEDMDNVDADVLADLYNSNRAGAFNAYMHGSRFADLRYFVRPRGALPSVGSPEEVGLLYLNPGNETEGIWYLAHSGEEYIDGRAKATENKWSVDVDNYRITTEVARNGRLTATADIAFKAVANGERVVKFGLLPNLRVTSVKAGGAATSFIQEGRNQDGSFYVVMPEAMVKDRSYQLTVEYNGDKVVSGEGGGNFSVEARTSWYPSLNSFTDQAKYDLTFRVPRQYTLVSVGKPSAPKRDGDFTVSQWVSEVPLAVAGFNYGDFKKKDAPIDVLKYGLESYAATDVPDYLKPFANSMGGISPNAMSQTALAETDAAMRVYSEWFGKAPYGRIAVTQQPAFNYGQSWPSLVYLPMSAYLDVTQRYQLLGGINGGLNDFIQEVTAHEVAHQWWGHMVGWASYRDQWLSEGFADFSAGLFLQMTNAKPDKYYDFLRKSRDKVLDKNNFGVSPNDAGPLSMGIRLNTPRSGRAYQNLVYPKGAYVLHMLRSMFWDAKTGDQEFKAMMQDFVASHLFKTASTESFQAIVEKHMRPEMNLAGNGMKWFFDEWVHGTDVPKYQFDYEITPAADGKFLMKASLGQSGVGENFVMPVPLYMEVDGRSMRLGTVVMKGNSTRPQLQLMLPVRPKKISINAAFDILAYK